MSVLSILILTEDSGKQAHQTLERLLIATFSMIEPGYQPRRLRFKEQNELGQARLAVVANEWESRKPKMLRHKRDLRRLIAEQLLLHPPGIVVFHFDGDKPWSKRSTCTRFTNFVREIEDPVRQLIKEEASGREDEALRRLLLVTPFYSIESWLYQHAERLQHILEKSYRGQDMDTARLWEQDPAILDEMLKPKERICIRDGHNSELAHGFPADKVYRLGTSYQETVERLLNCIDLTEGLKRTWEEPGS